MFKHDYGTYIRPMRTMRFMAFALAIMSGFTSWATPMAPIRMLVQPQDHILIKGYRGKIEYLTKDNTNDVTITAHEIEKTAPAVAGSKPISLDDWQLSVRRENGVILVIVDGPTTKQTWNELLLAGQMSAEVPEFDLTITGPSRPMEISWHDGPIHVDGLNADLHVTTIKSALTVLHGQGDATISIQEGSLDLRERKGQIAIESYTAKVDLLKTEGPIRLENFAGDSLVQVAEGPMSLTSFKGSTKLSSIKGSLNFKNGIAPIHIEKFEGELRGQSSQGPVFADIAGEPDVRVQSAEGAVTLHAASNGAWVNVGTSDGAMNVPSYLKLTRLQTQQIRTGKLKGNGGGSIYVRTTSGEIHLK
jgi:DUF4097 and DUF4098 domain-containing protein YvlB